MDCLSEPREAMNQEDFDPYYQWLGIAPSERPIDYYRLLGLERFEADAARIAAAADDRMRHVRTFQTGPRGLFTQQLLNELAAAKLRLLRPDTKAAYDRRLRESAQAAAEFAQHDDLELPEPVPPGFSDLPPPVAFPLGVPVVGLQVPSRDVPEAAGPALPASPPARPAPLVTVPTTATRASRRKKRRLWPRLAGVLACLALAAVLIWGLNRRPDEADRESAGLEGGGAGAGGDGPSAATAVDPQVALQSAAGVVTLTAATVEIHGTTPRRGSDDSASAIVGWSSSEDWLSWRFRLQKGAVFRVQISYALDVEPAGARLRVLFDDQVKSWDLRSSGAPSTSLADETLVQIQEPGEHRLEVRVADLPAGATVRLDSVTLTPYRRRAETP